MNSGRDKLRQILDKLSCKQWTCPEMGINVPIMITNVKYVYDDGVIRLDAVVPTPVGNYYEYVDISDIPYERFNKYKQEVK